MDVHDDRIDPVELLRIELHLGLDDVKRLRDDGGHESGGYPAREVDGCGRAGGEPLLRDILLGLQEEHEVEAGERGVAEQRGKQAASQSAGALRLVDHPQGVGHVAVLVHAALKHRDK